MESSPPFVHAPFPISRITSSTIVLGSSVQKLIPLSAAVSAPPATGPATPSPSPDMSEPVEHVQQSPTTGHVMNTIMGPATQNGPDTIAIPFSDQQIEASAVLVTSNDPPERCTSPRRDNVAIERIGREKVQVLRKEAQLIQESLAGILDNIMDVKSDFDRLSSENKFLQDYIGNLMSTSNILTKKSHLA